MQFLLPDGDDEIYRSKIHKSKNIKDEISKIWQNGIYPFLTYTQINGCKIQKKYK